MSYIGERNAKGERHGHGTFTYPNGDIYTGEWRDGVQHGQGTLTFSSGRTVGSWNMGYRHGPAVFTDIDGNVYDVMYDNGSRVSSVMRVSDTHIQI